MERLRLTYGGDLQFGPWPPSCSVLKGPVEITNLPKGISSDCNYGLSDAFEIDRRPFAEKNSLVTQLEKLSSMIFPENKLLHLYMLEEKHHHNLMTLDDKDCIVSIAERYGVEKKWQADVEEGSKTGTHSDASSDSDSDNISVCSSLAPRQICRKKQLRPLAEMSKSVAKPTTSGSQIVKKMTKFQKQLN